MTTALVVGYGSIGQRHARLLGELGCAVSLVTQQTIEDFPAHRSLEGALAHAVDYVVVANETAQHAATVMALAELDFRGKLLVEKPLAAAPFSIPTGCFAQVAVAYNLRFHPMIAALRERLKDDPAVAINIRCGHHLSAWRPRQDFRQGYSAHASRGGGVLRDLSHELDYLLWLGGAWRRVTALGGNLDVLGIEADESWSLLLELTGCPAVGVQLNYIDATPRREIIINTRSTTLAADLIGGVLCEGNREERFAVGRDDSYLAMHKAMLAGSDDVLCSAAEASAVLQLIEAVQTASNEGRWVNA